jgi:putative hydrolase of the HAD superfamily
MRKKEIKNRSGVLFDLYGTLLDVEVDELSPEFWVKLAAHTEVGKRAGGGEELRMVYNLLMTEECNAGTEHGFFMASIFQKLLARFQVAESDETPDSLAWNFRKYSIVSLELKPYTVELLSLLRQRNIAVGVLSNTEALLSEYDLTVTGLKKYLDSITLSSDIKVKKPNPMAFDIALQRMGLPKSAVIYVGDNLADDVAGALGASMDVLYINDRKEPVELELLAQNRVVRANPSLASILKGLAELDVLAFHS